MNEEFGLLELREITLGFEAADLRRLARFLDHFANRVESRALRSGHEHLTSFDREWRRDHLDLDVILTNPDPEPPARLK